MYLLNNTFRTEFCVGPSFNDGLIAHKTESVNITVSASVSSQTEIQLIFRNSEKSYKCYIIGFYTVNYWSF